MISVGPIGGPAWLTAPEWVFFALLYAAVLGFVAFDNRRELARDPDKRARYQALPRYYKLACPLVVAPLFAAFVFHELFGLLALVCFMLLDAACVRWYRKAGLL